MTTRNVSRLVEPPRQTRREMRTLAVGQVTTQLLPALKGQRLYAAFLTLFMMGLRRSELLGLRWQEVDWKAEVMHIRQTLVRVKNHEIGRTQLVFQEPKTEHSRRTIPRNLNLYFSQALQRADLPAIRLHDARHTYATWLLEQGVSPKVVQTMLGHSSITMTLAIYSHVSLDLEKQAAAKLDAALTSGLQ